MDRNRIALRMRWIIFSGLLLTALSVASCCKTMTPSELQIRSDVALLAQDTHDNEAFLRLRKAGAAAVPALIEALERQDGSLRQKDEVISCLSVIRDHRAIPALVRFSDREGWFLVSDEVVAFGRWDESQPTLRRKYLALRARVAIGLTVIPTSKTKWGGWRIWGTSGKIGTEEYQAVLEEEKAYWRKVNSWYQDFRERFDFQDFQRWLERANQDGSPTRKE